MMIEHAVSINAGLERVWSVFVDLSCWHDWNTVASIVDSDEEHLTEGKGFQFCIRPFVLPLNVKPVVEKLIPGKHVIWSGSKFGITARHEFIFEQGKDNVLLTSRESFQGGGFQSILILFSRKKLNRLSVQLLNQLKDAAEMKRAAG